MTLLILSLIILMYLFTALLNLLILKILGFLLKKMPYMTASVTLLSHY